jgi:hypothetical protein
MNDENYELNLDAEEPKSALESMDAAKEAMSEDELTILNELETLSNKCADAGVPCFLTAKFPSQDDPSAAWYFGKTPPEAHETFINDFAALLLHITSKMTLTSVKATNPQTGAVVYEVEPDRDGNQGEQS